MTPLLIHQWRRIYKDTGGVDCVLTLVRGPVRALVEGRAGGRLFVEVTGPGPVESPLAFYEVGEPRRVYGLRQWSLVTQDEMNIETVDALEIVEWWTTSTTIVERVDGTEKSIELNAKEREAIIDGLDAIGWVGEGPREVASIRRKLGDTGLRSRQLAQLDEEVAAAERELRRLKEARAELAGAVS